MGIFCGVNIDVDQIYVAQSKDKCCPQCSSPIISLVSAKPIYSKFSLTPGRIIVYNINIEDKEQEWLLRHNGCLVFKCSNGHFFYFEDVSYDSIVEVSKEKLQEPVLLEIPELKELTADDRVS